MGAAGLFVALFSTSACGVPQPNDVYRVVNSCDKTVRVHIGSVVNGFPEVFDGELRKIVEPGQAVEMVFPSERPQTAFIVVFSFPGDVSWYSEFFSPDKLDGIGTDEGVQLEIHGAACPP